MRILILEDRKEIMDGLCFFLKNLSEEHEIYPCYNIYDANKYKQESISENTNIDCYIFDLAMSNSGIEKDKKEETGEGYFTGWVWIKYNVIEKKPNDARKCVVYSAYLDSFHNLNKKPEETSIIEKMLVVNKSDINFYTKLEKRLNQISKWK
jgi:hypothetical protein